MAILSAEQRQRREAAPSMARTALRGYSLTGQCESERAQLQVGRYDPPTQLRQSGLQVASLYVIEIEHQRCAAGTCMVLDQ